MDRLRGFVAQAHQENFTPDMNLRTSVNLTTDTSFLSDYGEKSGDYNRQYNDTTVNFIKTWQNYALTADLRYTQDYYTTENPVATKAQNLLNKNDFGLSNKSTLQTLPETRPVRLCASSSFPARSISTSTPAPPISTRIPATADSAFTGFPGSPW